MKFWEEEGLNVDVIGVGGTALAVQQLAAGQIQFATVGPEAMLIAREKGIPIVSVYSFTTPIYETVVEASSPIRSYADLKGKVIGVPEFASGSMPYSKNALKDAGLDPENDAKFLAVGLGSQAAAAFRQKEIDAWSTWDTGVAALENMGFEFIKIDPAWTKEMPGNVLVTLEDTLKERPDLVVKFARGLAKATIVALANPPAVVRNHWEMYPSTKPTDTSEKGFNDSLHIYNSRNERLRKPDEFKWGFHDDKTWDRLLDFTVNDGLISESFDIRAAYTNDLIDEINDFDEEAIVTKANQPNW